MVSETEVELRAYLGKNADYYLERWLPYLDPEDSGTLSLEAYSGGPLSTPQGGFHWPAFLISPAWLSYRKLYIPMTIYGAAQLLQVGGLEGVYVGLLGYEATPQLLAHAISLFMWLFCGLFANHWYFLQARRQILNARENEPEMAERLTLLERRGGTSFVSVGVCSVLLLLAAMAMILTVKQVVPNSFYLPPEPPAAVSQDPAPAAVPAQSKGKAK